MNGWMILIILVVGVPATIGALGELYKTRAKYKYGNNNANDVALADAIAKIERLEHRVRVLERIETDNNPRLAAEIEALRLDGPPTDRGV